MGLFNFVRKSNSATPKKWDSLSVGDKIKVMKTFRNYSGAHYRIVQGDDQNNRPWGRIETQTEDKYLDFSRRGRLLDQVRNACRNSATFNTILKQLDYNVVGTKGGKVIFNFPEDNSVSEKLKSEFSIFTRNADFFDGVNFNTLLKLILKTQLTNGDCVILFDDGLIENSGKLLVYEGDEIGNTTDEAIRKHYGKYARQSLGKVYSQNGRWIGTVVSRACRGESCFDPEKCYFLHRDPDSTNFSSSWIQPSTQWRIAQGRGITQSASAIGAILDLEDLCGFELQSAKKNSQTFCQILNTATKDNSQIPSAFDTSTDFSSMTDEEIEAAVKAETEGNEQVVSFRKAASCGIVYEQLPDNYKMELLDTKHPNQNIQAFVEWLAGRSSAVYGLSRAYATGNPTGSDFRAQQLMSQPAFSEYQKSLEGICDWVIYKFAWYLDGKGIISAKDLPEKWLQYVGWEWPALDEADQVATQNAINLKLQNLTGSYRDILGNGWKEKLLQIRDEIQWFHNNGLSHPSEKMISGGETSSATKTLTEGEKENAI